MRYEASKLWRTGILSPCFPFADFSGSLPTVKHFKYSVESLRSLRFVFFFLSPFCLKGKKCSVPEFLKSVEERTQMLKTYSLVWLAWLLRLINVSAVQFSFQTSEILSFFSTWLETCAICLLLPLREHWGKTRVPSLAQQLNLAVPCLLGCVAVTASPLTEMD